MPRPYSVTRKGRAAKLLRLVKTGPAFDDLGGQEAFGPKEAAKQYRRWAESWVLDELCNLLPELKDIAWGSVKVDE